VPVVVARRRGRGKHAANAIRLSLIIHVSPAPPVEPFTDLSADDLCDADSHANAEADEDANPNTDKETHGDANFNEATNSHAHANLRQPRPKHLRIHRHRAS